MRIQISVKDVYTQRGIYEVRIDTFFEGEQHRFYVEANSDELKSDFDYIFDVAKEEIRRLIEETGKTKKKFKNDAERFLDHLQSISHALDIDWWDGEFPIKEVLERIKV